MKSNKYLVNKLYDNFFLSKTFNTLSLKKNAKLEIQWLINKLNLSNKNKILDVACGPGRHLEALLNKKFYPYGVDISKACISLAKKKCKKISKQIFCQDFIDFTKVTNEKFDVVFLLGASFGYEKIEKNNDKYLKAALEILNPGGFFVIQFLNESFFKNQYNKTKKFWHEDSEYFILESRAVDQNILFSRKIFISKKNKKIRQYNDHIYLYGLKQLASKLKKIDKKISFQSCNDGFNDIQYSNTSVMPVVIFKKR